MVGKSKFSHQNLNIEKNNIGMWAQAGQALSVNPGGIDYARLAETIVSSLIQRPIIINPAPVNVDGYALTEITFPYMDSKFTSNHSRSLTINGVKK